MSAYLVVVLSVLASATATLTLNLLARLDWRQARGWLRPAPGDTQASPDQLLEPRQGACGCLTVAGAVALLHEQGYLPFGQLGSGGELLPTARPPPRSGPLHPTRSPPSSSAPWPSAPLTSSRPATWTPPPWRPPAAPTAPPSPATRHPTRPASPRC